MTNGEFKRFVDAGGYRDPKYWKRAVPRRRSGLERSTRRSRGSAIRPGERARRRGSSELSRGAVRIILSAASAGSKRARMPIRRQGSADDLSLVSGRSAGGNLSEILRLSNFDGKGPLKSGERQGLGPWGTLDMAGNVKEWCANAVEGSGLRYILGGGWNEPHYRYVEEDARSPWDRRPHVWRAPDRQKTVRRLMSRVRSPDSRGSQECHSSIRRALRSLPALLCLRPDAARTHV